MNKNKIERQRKGIVHRIFMRLPPSWRERVWEALNPGGCWHSSYWPTRFSEAKPGAPIGTLAAMVLAARAHELGLEVGGTLEVDIDGHTVGGGPTGDWRVTIEKLRDADQ